MSYVNIRLILVSLACSCQFLWAWRWWWCPSSRASSWGRCCSTITATSSPENRSHKIKVKSTNKIFTSSLWYKSFEWFDQINLELDFIMCLGYSIFFLIYFYSNHNMLKKMCLFLKRLMLPPFLLFIVHILLFTINIAYTAKFTGVH